MPAGAAGHCRAASPPRATGAPVRPRGRGKSAARTL